MKVSLYRAELPILFSLCLSVEDGIFILILNFMNLTTFFGQSNRDVIPVNDEIMLTPVLVPERTDKGAVVISEKLLETIIDPLATLSFEDFRIEALLRAGIQPSAIHLKSDIRIGSDKDIQKFNERVDKLAEQMFNN